MPAKLNTCIQGWGPPKPDKIRIDFCKTGPKTGPKTASVDSGKGYWGTTPHDVDQWSQHHQHDWGSDSPSTSSLTWPSRTRKELVPHAEVRRDPGVDLDKVKPFFVLLYNAVSRLAWPTLCVSRFFPAWASVVVKPKIAKDNAKAMFCLVPATLAGVAPKLPHRENRRNPVQTGI